MALHLVAYSESVDAADALNGITPVVDPTVGIDGDFVRVPALNNLAGYACLTSTGGTNRVEINCPSLAEGNPLDVEPIVNALVWGSPPEVIMFKDNPYPLVKGDGLRVQQRSDPAAAERQYALVYFSDGKLIPIAGEIRTVRFTTSITLSAGAWVAGAITLQNSLPKGKYQVVGMRVRSTNGVAARLIIPGYIWRPGVAIINAIGDLDPVGFRNGALGSWGEFDTEALPTLEVLGVTDTTEIGFLDLIKVG